MTSRIDIVNRALSAIAAKSTLVTMNDRSTEGIQARLLYEPTRDELLRSAPWNFARKMENLTLLKAAPGTPQNPNANPNIYDPQTMPPPPWLYSYAYPSDCLQVRAITSLASQPGLDQPMFSVILPTGYTPNNLVPSRFAVANDTDNSNNQVRVILCDRISALCVYTRLVDVEEMWDPLFQETMVRSLASRFCMPVTGKMDMTIKMAQSAMQIIQTARSRDGNEGTSTTDYTPDWIAVRGYGGTVLGSDGAPNTSVWWTPSFLQF